MSLKHLKLLIVSDSCVVMMALFTSLLGVKALIFHTAHKPLWIVGFCLVVIGWSSTIFFKRLRTLKMLVNERKHIESIGDEDKFLPQQQSNNNGRR